MSNAKKRPVRKKRNIICVELGQSAPLFNAARKCRPRATLREIVEECIIGHLGPRYPKVMLKCEVERPAAEILKNA